MNNSDFDSLRKLGDGYEANIQQLMSFFPGIANRLAWNDAAEGAQVRLGMDKLRVANLWIALAKENRLSVFMNPARGLMVSEK